jgi:glycerol-3-phosphate dehydrogenase
VLSLIAADPALGRPLAGADDYLRAEILYAASHEGARHLADMLVRRTHIAIETADRGLEVAEEAAELAAGPLHWDSGQAAREVEHYRAEVAAQQAAEEALSDSDADTIAGAVPDIVPVRAAADARR